MRDYSFITELDSEELRREAYRELGKVDLYFLAAHILRYNLETQTDIHYRFCELAEQDKLRQLYIMFRGSFKTSLGIAKIIQWLIQDPSAQIGLGSDKIERAMERVQDLRRVLESNELLQELYPEVFHKNPARESDLWTGAAINIIRPPDKLIGFTKPSVSAFGLFPLPTGSHYTHVLLDDVENEGNVNTPELIHQLNVRLSSLFPVLHPTAPIIMLGTIYCSDGPNTNYQRAWPTYKVPVVDKRGLPTFPSRFPIEYINKIRDDMNDEYIWAGQFMVEAAVRTDLFTFPFKNVTLNTFEEML